MSVNEVVPLLAVDDLRRSLTFYVDGLGFTVKDQWPAGGELRWCRLQLDGAGLMLQEFETEGHDAREFSSSKGDGVALWLFCDDAIELYHLFAARGIKAKEPFVGNALWVTSVEDPDGYRLDFESPTDVPEETRLSDVGAAGNGST